jgi:uncharacterized membrane protein YraQ (UPF0718 family)
MTMSDGFSLGIGIILAFTAAIAVVFVVGLLISTSRKRSHYSYSRQATTNRLLEQRHRMLDLFPEAILENRLKRDAEHWATQAEAAASPQAETQGKVGLVKRHPIAEAAFVIYVLVIAVGFLLACFIGHRQL